MPWPLIPVFSAAVSVIVVILLSLVIGLATWIDPFIIARDYTRHIVWVLWPVLTYLVYKDTH